MQVGDLGAGLGVLVLVLLDGLGDRALQRVEPADQRLDVLGGGDRDAAVEPGRDLDVVDGEHVGRVGHRDQQRLLVDEADRQRPVAARRGDRDQVGRGHVDVVDGEVDVVEPVALGDRARELVGVDDALLEQQRLGGRPAVRASAIAGSTRSAVAKPSSTRTSVTKLAECPPRRGGVRPGGLESPRRAAWPSAAAAAVPAGDRFQMR